MKIADLFVNLGIKGDGSAMKALNGVKSGLEDTKSTGIAAKAALLAVVYGLERMTSSAGAQGQGLLQFAAATGKSTVELQKWQYAMLDFGVKGEEVEQSFRNITDAVAKMQLGQGAPAGLGMLMKATGLTEEDLEHPERVLKAVQAYSKMGDPAIIKQLTSWVGGDNLFAALRRYSGDASKVGLNHVISEREQEQLAKVDAAWAHIWQTIKMIGVHMTSAHGLFAIDELSKTIAMLERVPKFLSQLATQLPKTTALLAALAVGLGVAFAPWTALITGLVLLFGELEKVAEGKDNAFAKIGRWLDSKGLSPDKVKDIGGYGGGDPMKDFKNGKPGDVPSFMVPNKGMPSAPALKGDPRFSMGDVNVHVQSGSLDPTAHGKIAAREIVAAARTMPSVGWVS